MFDDRWYLLLCTIIFSTYLLIDCNTLIRENFSGPLEADGGSVSIKCERMINLKDSVTNIITVHAEGLER